MKFVAGLGSLPYPNPNPNPKRKKPTTLCRAVGFFIFGVRPVVRQTRGCLYGQ